MNKLLQPIIVVLIMSTTAFANEFNDAITAVFGEATNYFTFQGTFDSGSNTIALSKVTREKKKYSAATSFPLVISGSKTVTSGDTTTTYTITLSNGSELFVFTDANYPVVLTLKDISAPNICSSMFKSCGALKGLNLFNFDTSNVTKMRYMFNYCTRLAKLDLSGLDTSEVTEMEGMFQYCGFLSELDLSSFNTSKVTTMFQMFQFCTSLKKLDISNFDTGKVKDVGRLVKGCKALRVLKVSSDFPKNASASMGYMFSELTPDNLNGKIIIYSPDGTFNPRFEDFVRNSVANGIACKDITMLLHLTLRAKANMLTRSQNTSILFSDEAGILLENNSVLENVTTIKCPIDEGQRGYFVLADGATSATIKNFSLSIQHDEDFDEIENIYRTKTAEITGNYTCITEDGDETDNISIVDEDKFHLGSLTSLTKDDTVFFVIHPISGESLDQNTVVIKNEESEPAEIVANISNNVDKDGYTATDIELQGSLKFSGDQSGFVNGKATASGADIEFVGNKSMFQVPLELTNNSKVKISEFLNHERDITVDKGSQLEIKENVTFSGGTLRFGC